MKVSTYLSFMVRESRGSLGRLAFFAACLSVGVAAVVAVAGLADGLDRGIRREARRLLAADLVVESRRPLPDELDRALAGVPGTERADLKEMATVVAAPARGDAPGDSVLVELKVVEGGYPFYGELELEPPEPLAALVGSDRVVVGPELLERLRLAIGDTIRIGGQPFLIAGIVRGEPDRMNVSLTLGPRVFLSEDGLERAGLERFGSRIEYRALVRLADGATAEDARRVAERIREALVDPEYVRVETWVEAQPALRRGITQAEKFLGLVALLSLLVGGIGVAQAVRAWLAGRMDAIAILRSLGMRPREVLALYLTQTVLLGAAGSIVGVVGGMAVQQLVPTVLERVLPVSLSSAWHPAAAVRGLALGIGVAVLFGLQPLMDVLRVPPARVLRRDAEPLPVTRAAWGSAWAALLAGIAVTAVAQSGSVIQGSIFTVGVVVATGALAVASQVLVSAVGRMPRDFATVGLRHGLAALARPGAGTLGAIVALGLGVLVVLGMYLVQERLGAQLHAELPDDAPTAFLVDIQPDQWDGVRELLAEEGGKGIDSVAVVMARLRAVDGRPVSEMLDDGEDPGRRRWVLTREQRLTSMESLPEGNTILEGALWSDPDRSEISIERDFAADLGVGVGSTLDLDIQGVPLTLAVTSIRSVEWERFSINFFLVVEPGVLDRAPQFRVATVRLPPGSESDVQNRLAATYPNVTVLRLREILEKVVSVLDRVGLGVRLLGAFTVLSGVAILGGAVSAGSVRRAREVALYKTLGMTRRGVVAVFATEYALVGLVAGGIGTAGAVVLGWAVVRFGLEIPWRAEPAAYVVAILGSVVLTVLAGVTASAGALRRRPVEALRHD